MTPATRRLLDAGLMPCTDPRRSSDLVVWPADLLTRSLCDFVRAHHSDLLQDARAAEREAFDLLLRATGKAST